VLLGVGILLVVSALLAMAVGAASLTTEQVWQFRVPRILLAVLVGMSLASSGSCLQGLFRNPLADPFLLGIAAGGALGATVGLLVSVPSPFIPLLAFLAALATAWLVARLWRVDGIGRVSPSTHCFPPC
jgi:iron complex transport system permease protein